MPAHHKPRQKADYRLEVIEDELLLFHPGETKIIYCNPTAALVWRLCDGQRATPEITALLKAAYPEASASLAAEVEAALQQFARHGAIEFV
jgi:hypothetical protein